MFKQQEVPEQAKESGGGPWQFLGLMPLFDPPRHDSAETIRRALNLGVSVKMITGKENAHIESALSPLIAPHTWLNVGATFPGAQ